MESDFKKFLIELGYSEHIVNIYISSLQKFSEHNGYKTIFDIADDVFILLNQGKHTDRHFKKVLLKEVKRYKAVLKLFNSFLFVVGYRRDFVRPCSSTTNFMFCLSVLTPSTATSPCVLYDKNKDWCTASEICRTIEIADSVLRYAREHGKPPHCYVVGKRRYRYRIDEINRFCARSFPKRQERKER